MPQLIDAKRYNPAETLWTGDAPDGERLEILSAVVRATLGDRTSLSYERVGIAASEAEAMLARARARLPDLLAWLEQNGRELLERT